MTSKCMTSGLMGESATIEWGTPSELFDKLDAEFHFTLDVCASDGMQMCKRYFNPETNGLLQEWGGGRDMLDESTLRKGDNRLGTQGSIVSSDHRSVTPSENGHTMVSEMGSTVRIGDSLHKGEGEIQGSIEFSTVPFGDCNIQYTENTEVWGD